MAQAPQPLHSQPILPLISQQNEGSSQGGHCFCWGRLWTWIVDYICLPIYQLFLTIFCCPQISCHRVYFEHVPIPSNQSGTSFGLEESLKNLSDESVIIENVPIIWEEVKNQFLSSDDDLPEPSETIISRALPNLAATCYLNSVLQMISQLSCFDHMLTKDLCFKAAPIRPGEDEEKYQSRCAEERSNFEETLFHKIALQSHLRSIITMMRRSNQSEEPIDRCIMEILFKLLQVNGWHKTPKTEQDPHELITFLSNVLDSNISEIHTVDKLSYVKESVLHEQIGDVNSIPDLQIALPVDDQKKIKPEYDSMKALIRNHLHNRLEGENAWRPPGEERCYDTDKTTYIVEPPPDTLFIQQLRFDYKLDPSTNEITPFRINDLVPFDPIITIPVYKSNNLNEEPVEHTYTLKIVIGHNPGENGTSTSVNSGHYTTWIRQKYMDLDTWIYYSDSRRARYPADPPHPEDLQTAIRKNGYYLAYVLMAPSYYP